MAENFQRYAQASRKVWWHRPETWLPAWYGRLGWPHIGGDEWGRRVITIGVAPIGYLSIAFRTCWCAECHEMRDQTYQLLREEPDLYS